MSDQATTELEVLLRLVAAGELTPEQALERLAPVPAAGPAPGAPDAIAGEASRSEAAASSPTSIPGWGTPPSRLPGGSPDQDARQERGRPGPQRTLREQDVRLVRINASYRSVDVIGDHTVATVVVVGPHAVRRDGDALVVESGELPFWPDAAEGHGGRFSFAVLPRGLAWARSVKDQHLVVRVNPSLAVEVDAAGAVVRLSGLDGGVRLRLLASVAKTERLRGTLDVDALTSSVKGSATPAGLSRIACESSSVKLTLDPGTDLRIRARNRMSKVVLPSAVSKGGLVDPSECEALVGDGSGELVVDAVMSSVLLSAAGVGASRVAGAVR